MARTRSITKRSLSNKLHPHNIAKSESSNDPHIQSTPKKKLLKGRHNISTGGKSYPSGVFKKKSSLQQSSFSTVANGEQRHYDTISRIFANLYIEVDSDIAKTNLLRLFHLSETESLIKPELYNDAENPLFKVHVKLAACFLLSEYRLRKDLLGVLHNLLLHLDSILEECGNYAEHDNSALSDQTLHKLRRLQHRFDTIVEPAELYSIVPEELFKRLTECFIDYFSDDCPPTLFTRKETGSYLSKCYGDKYTDYDWSRSSLALITQCLALPYDQPNVYER